MTDKETRQVKRVIISVRQLIQDYVQQREAPRSVQVYEHCLPEDYVVLGWHQSYSGLCLEILVHHPSFEEIPIGQQVPEWDGGAWKVYLLATQQEVIQRINNGLMPSSPESSPPPPLPIAAPVATIRTQPPSWRDRPPLL